MAIDHLLWELRRQKIVERAKKIGGVELVEGELWGSTVPAVSFGGWHRPQHYVANGTEVAIVAAKRVPFGWKHEPGDYDGPRCVLACPKIDDWWTYIIPMGLS